MEVCSFRRVIFSLERGNGNLGPNMEHMANEGATCSQYSLKFVIVAPHAWTHALCWFKRTVLFAKSGRFFLKSSRTFL